MVASRKRGHGGAVLEKILVGRKEAAALLSVSLRTIDYLIQRGALAARKIGKRTLVPVAALKKLAEHGAGGAA